MTKSLKIAFFTLGRFHLVDLASQLQDRGHRIQFISLLPAWKLRERGLNPESANGVGLAAWAPFLLDRFLSGRVFSPALRRLTARLADQVAAAKVKDCDVAVSMSGIGCQFLEEAQKRFGALTVTERLSTHIERQREILSEIPNWDQNEISDLTITRELRSYRSADIISIPSQFVARSFGAHRELTPKLEINPLGVDFREFSPADKPRTAPVIINAGTWCLRKGCDLLAAACDELDIRLHHVGPVGDCELPTFAGFEHFDPVPQSKLAEHYANAHVFALPSREDGFGMVLAQALACGLPIVCSDHTGGPDLKEMSINEGAVSICRTNNVESLKGAIMTALQFSKGLPNKRRALINPSTLSWSSYSKRYEAMLLRRLGHENPTK